jgi:flagellum-specific peptidoglycan hydrolase FlgJ
MRWPTTLAIGGGLFLLARSAFAKASTGERAALSNDDRLRFVSDLYGAISRVWPEASLATQHLVLALAAYESGYGVSSAYRLGRNSFNIVRGSADVPSIDGPDQDCSSGVCRPITQKFRSYASVDDSVADFLALMRTSRYRTAYSLLVAGDIGFAEALGSAGYYTLPISSYVANFRGVLAGVLKRLAMLAQS